MPITQAPAAMTRMSIFKGFLGTFLPICLVLLIIGAMHYYVFISTETAAIESRESLNVGLAQRMIEKEIADIVSDLRFLAKHIESQGLTNELSWPSEQRISLEFKIFAREKAYYDQIRYIDRSGMEIVRVNYNHGEVMVVPLGQLQNKANRYYFQEAMALDKGGIYLSRFDLNIEKGKIEVPYKPVIRFGTPVYNRQNEKQGILLLNYLGDRLIKNFLQAAANIDDHIELLDHEGFWISSPVPEIEWGFMLNHGARFQSDKPQAWKLIQNNNSGQFQSESGLFTFATVQPIRIARITAGTAAGLIPLKNATDRETWKIVSRVSSEQLSATLGIFLKNHFTLYFSMLLLLSGGSWLLANSRLQHRASEAQRDYEQRFRYTLENMELLAVALDREGKVMFCNDYLLRLIAWRRDEVIGKNWFDEFAIEAKPDDTGPAIRRMTNPASFPMQYEGWVKSKDGKEHLIAWNNTPSYDADGTVIGITGIGEEITDKRLAEIELIKLFRAVEQSPSTVMITDYDGKIEYVNPKFTAVSGYTAAEVAGKNPKLLKSGETSQQEYHTLWDRVRNGGEWRGEFHNKRKNGELYWESAVISGIRNPKGKITHFLAVKEDITERKRLEAEVEQQNRELAYAETMAVMGRMASMIAHDLRNPLSSVKMTLQILSKQLGAQNSEEISILRQISLEQIRYMEEILSDMLSYSRPGALSKEWITIDKVIDMAVSLSQRRLDENKVELRKNYHPGIPTLYGDATKLRQVFSNLISNAAQATEGIIDPLITIDVMLELGFEGTAIRVDICDNGSGISADQQEKIFEPFFTTRAKGTGLGLAIVKRILDLHNSTIKVSNNMPQGTCITVVLPVSPRQRNVERNTVKVEMLENE